MAMMDILYRFSDRPLADKNIRRDSTGKMEAYIRDLVFEMQSADISVKYEHQIVTDDGPNMVFINGRSVPEILRDLNIVLPEQDDESCGCGPTKPIKFERPMLDWKNDFIEDIPDVLMKNAISKTYSDMEKNRIL